MGIHANCIQQAGLDSAEGKYPRVVKEEILN